MKRRGFSLEDRKLIKKVYQIYFQSGMNRDDAINKIQSKFSESDAVKKIMTFINKSDRGII